MDSPLVFSQSFRSTIRNEPSSEVLLGGPWGGGLPHGVQRLSCVCLVSSLSSQLAQPLYPHSPSPPYPTEGWTWGLGEQEGTH